MKSAQIIAPNNPLEINETELPRPHGNEVIIKVKSTGVCHSDLHLWEGGDPSFSDTDSWMGFIIFFGISLIVS